MNSTNRNRSTHWHKAVLALSSLLMVGCDKSAEMPPSASVGDIRRDATVAAIERSMPSVVNIRLAKIVTPLEETYFRRRFGISKSEQPEINSIGSGVIIDEIGEDGYILTNFHVIQVQEDSRVQVQLQDGREYEARPLLWTSQKDLALLKITRKPGDKPFKPIQFAKDDDLLLGETVIAVGNPFGLGGSVSRGILSSKNRRSMSGGMKLDYPDWLQTDADINLGNSGGALINTRGELIGINVAVLGQDEGKGTGFAIPVKQIGAAMSDFFSLEWTAKLWLGARFRGAPYPLIVREVQPNSPADKAGLKIGQLVMEVNGKAVKGLGDFNLHMAANADHTAKVTVSENGRRQTVKVEMIPMEALTRQMILSRLGLVTQQTTAEQATSFRLNKGEGLMVTEVEEKSPASTAALVPGLVLLKVDGVAVADQVRVTNVLGNKKPGERAVLTFKALNRQATGLIELREAQIELPAR